MDGCVFCKIIAREIPSYQVYEDELFVAFLDAFPGNPGHALVVPKAHVTDIFELDSPLSLAVMPVVQRVAQAVKQATGCTGVNIMQNNGADAGQSVFHYHVHVFPRYAGDGHQLHPQVMANKPEPASMAELADKIHQKTERRA